MKRMRALASVLAIGILLACPGRAQEKPKTPEEPKAVTPLKVQVVVSEFEGEKKVASLPYTFFVNADDRPPARTSLRMGLRVPIAVGPKESTSYFDVGTNMDCLARTTEDARFKLELTVERSSLYAASPDKKSLDWSPGDAPLSAQPILRSFRVTVNLLVRDGQTVQSTTAADPLSGRMLKIEVTAWAVK